MLLSQVRLLAEGIQDQKLKDKVYLESLEKLQHQTNPKD